MKSLVLLVFTLLCLHGFGQTIVNGVPWFDQNGNTVNAHGAGIIRDGGRWWLFGEYKSDTTNVFPGFGCYSSDDLVHWIFERVVLPVQKDGILGPQRVGERPKVMRCPKTGEYVLFAHADDMKYTDPHTVVATCVTIDGDYRLRGTLQYKGKPIRKWDIGVFQDTDGRGYLLCHHGPIYRLSDDYLSVDTMIADVMDIGESPAMFKKDGIYYLLTSNLTSWERNDNYYFTATNIAGPWMKHGTFSPKGTLTWNSQTTCVLILPDGTPMYMGDRWSYPHQASCASYVWLPMQIDGDSLSIPQYWETWNPHTLKAIDMLCGGKQLSMGFDSNKPGESVSIQFRGCQAAITGKTDRHGGYALVTVNDRRGKTVFSSLVDCYSLVPSEGIRLLTPVLLYGCYRITVKVTGDRPKWSDKRKNNYGSDDCRVRIDALYVFKAPVH
ncbi:family 43 glycosylhydrolase [Hallella seregens]|uniref:Family 43 glycosylhydrolase n=1 Tax=Hallella seregens ATCC 51272 TaxID=1336250 RepID=A0ABV5ZGQ9_9BACT|nr:family 43 glycosylhydrolase [Hallella seregens]